MEFVFVRQRCFLRSYSISMDFPISHNSSSIFRTASQYTEKTTNGQLIMALMGSVTDGSKCDRIHRVFAFAITLGILIWQTPFSTGFVVGELSNLARIPTTTDTGPCEKVSIIFSVLMAKLEDEMGEEVLATGPETKSISPAISDDPSSNIDSNPESKSFSEFASNQTPLLAGLLSSENERKEFALSSSDLREENKELSQPTLWQERSSEWAVVGLSTFALVGILGDLLSNYEWVQTLRYLWPLSLGVYYGLLLNQANDRDALLRRKTMEEFGPSSAYSPSTTRDDDEIKDLLLQVGYVFGGFGLFVGGLADALLPVWMTGPNLITNAGLAPDCAILLLVLTIGDQYNLFRTNNDSKRDDGSKQETGNLLSSESVATTGMATLLVRITLWAELYKLGEGSLDEVFSNVQSLLSVST